MDRWYVSRYHVDVSFERMGLMIVMKEVTADPKPAAAPLPVEPERRGMARRAPSASVYL